MNAPLRFEPYLRPMVWGGRQLGEILGKSLPEDGAYGESWEISDHSSHASVVADGSYKGQTLRQLLEREPVALLGPLASRYPRFPWLVKFLDAWDWLSVQVHPDDEKAARLWPGEGGKTEAWFVLSATEKSRVYAGLLPGVDEARLRAALAAGPVGDCLHSFSPRPGDCVFLPAGTVHAVGGGVLLAEVQQTSDATFRLFDWNRRDSQGRSRQLHIEEALACIDWKAGPVQPVRAKHFADEEKSTFASIRQRLVSCSYFTLEYIRENSPFTCGGGERTQVMIVLRGRGRLWTGQGVWELSAGNTLLLPAALDTLACHPEGDIRFLLATLSE